MALMFEFLINVIIILFLLKLIYLYLSLQHMCERSGIIKKANVENIRKAIFSFDWNKAFENLSVEEKVDFLKLY